MIVIVVLSVVVVRRKEPPLSSTDIFGSFQAEDHFENNKNTCNHKNSTFQKKKKILKTLELLPTRVECYNTISRPNDGIQKLKNLKFFFQIKNSSRLSF
jgi:hypothetical protein